MKPTNRDIVMNQIRKYEQQRDIVIGFIKDASLPGDILEKADRLRKLEIRIDTLLLLLGELN